MTLIYIASLPYTQRANVHPDLGLDCCRARRGAIGQEGQESFRISAAGFFQLESTDDLSMLLRVMQTRMEEMAMAHGGEWI
jgi:hypothetical protein